MVLILWCVGYRKLSTHPLPMSGICHVEATGCNGTGSRNCVLVTVAALRVDFVSFRFRKYGPPRFEAVVLIPHVDLFFHGKTIVSRSSACIHPTLNIPKLK